jgi:hypothetical protein
MSGDIKEQSLGDRQEWFAGPPGTEAWLFLGVALVAAVLRMLVMGNAHRVIPTDGVSYLEIAKNIGTRFLFFHPVFPPGYPLWVALLQKLTGVAWIKAGQWTSFVFSLLLLMPLYAVFRRCVGIPAAMLGLLFYACLPIWVKYGTETQSMSVGAFWFFLSLALCLHAIMRPDRRMIVMLGAGIALGLAALSRPEMLVGAVVLPLWILYRRKESLRSVGPWLVLVACFAVYSPYVVMLHGHTGHWQISMKTEANLRGAMAVGKHDFNAVKETNMQLPADRFSQGLLSFWFSDPWATIKRVGVNGYLMLQIIWPQQFPVILTFFMALGLVVAGGRNLDVLGVVSLVYLPSLTFLIDARIMLPWATVFLAWAGAGSMFLLRRRRPVGIAVLICSVVLLVGAALHIRRQDNGDIAARTAGVWLGAHAAHHGAWVWSRKPWVAFYAGMERRALPKDADIDAFIQPMRAGDWLVVDNRRFSVARPEAFTQLFAGDMPSRLVLEKQFIGPDGDTLNLYRLGPTAMMQRHAGHAAGAALRGSRD